MFVPEIPPLRSIEVDGAPGWVQCVADDGNEFFYNKDTCVARLCGAAFSEKKKDVCSKAARSLAFPFGCVYCPRLVLRCSFPFVVFFRTVFGLGFFNGRSCRRSFAWEVLYGVGPLDDTEEDPDPATPTKLLDDIKPARLTKDRMHQRKQGTSLLREGT